MINKILFLFLFSFSSIQYGMTQIISMEGYIAPSISKINTQGHDIGLTYLFPINFGMQSNLQVNKFLFSLGIEHLTQGAKFELEMTSASFPEGLGQYYNVYERAKALVFPIRANYFFVQKNKTKIFAGIGFKIGAVYSQQQENTSIPKDYVQPSSMLSAYPVQRFTDIEIVDDFYIGANAGAGMIHQFSNKFYWSVYPNFLFQLRKNLPKDTYAWTNRLMSFSLQMGIGYMFSKQKPQ